MSDIVYLTVAGEQQGAISDGCGTVASVGNRNQIGHEDEIFTFSLTNSVTSTGKGSQLHGLRFCKLIDKSTPLFVNAINKNEQLYGVLFLPHQSILSMGKILLHPTTGSFHIWYLLSIQTR